METERRWVTGVKRIEAAAKNLEDRLRCKKTENHETGIGEFYTTRENFRCRLDDGHEGECVCNPRTNIDGNRH